MAAIRLAVVDDSTFARKALVRILENEPQIRLVGAAASGEELLANLGKWRPEVITLDLHMPGMGGLETLDRIMAWRNIPVIVLSTHSAKEAPMTIEALHRGAVDFIDKQQHSLVDFGGLRKVLLEKILTVTENRPRRPDKRPTVPSPTEEGSSPRSHLSESGRAGAYHLLAIGASTGGPPALQQLLEGLVSPPPVPVVIVQHMPEGFTAAFAHRLDGLLPFRVKEPSHNETLVAGTVYIGPAGKHLVIREKSSGLFAHLTTSPAKASHCPSVDVLFNSAASLAGGGTRTLAVLLTGMGSDGAEGMVDLAGSGATTLAQDEATSVIWGMPKVAISLNAIDQVLGLPAMAPRINELLIGF